MNIEPYWGTLVGLGVAPLIKMCLDNRKARKLSDSGRCPTCGAELVDKPFTTVILRVCPQKHGYLSGDHLWMRAKSIDKMTRGHRNRPIEDLPQQNIIFAAMYDVLFSDGPLDTSPVDNAPRTRQPTGR